MAAGQGDQAAAGQDKAAGKDNLRASHADREHVIESLKVAFVHGRLTMDELDARVGRAFTARTYAELAMITADIPAEVAAAAPPCQPARTAGKKAGKKAAASAIAAAPLIGLVSVAVMGGNPFQRLLLMAFAIPVLALLLGSLLALHSWLDKRAVRQLTSGPGRGGPGLGGQRPAGTGRDRGLPGARADDTSTDDTSTNLRADRPRPAPSRTIRAPRGMRPEPGVI